MDQLGRVLEDEHVPLKRNVGYCSPNILEVLHIHFLVYLNQCTAHHTFFTLVLTHTPYTPARPQHTDTRGSVSRRKVRQSLGIAY